MRIATHECSVAMAVYPYVVVDIGMYNSLMSIRLVFCYALFSFTFQ